MAGTTSAVVVTVAVVRVAAGGAEVVVTRRPRPVPFARRGSSTWVGVERASLLSGALVYMDPPRITLPSITLPRCVRRDTILGQLGAAAKRVSAGKRGTVGTLCTVGELGTVEKLGTAGTLGAPGTLSTPGTLAVPAIASA